VLIALVSFASSAQELKDLPACPKPPSVTPSDTYKATVYDDGKSCPGGCKEPHVVFDLRDNGIARAHAPDSKSGEFKPCVKGRRCRICFKIGNDPKDCMEETFHGGGPARGRFDFSVAFFRKRCGEAHPKPVADMCAYINRQHGNYKNRFNCFTHAEDPRCKKVIDDAKRAKLEDLADHTKCKAVHARAKPLPKECPQVLADQKKGTQVDANLLKECQRDVLEEFNRAVTPERRRTHACDYALNPTIRLFKGKDAAGKDCKKESAWKDLKPAACGDNTLVGKFALNCCNPDPFITAALSSDCDVYFLNAPKPPVSAPVNAPSSGLVFDGVAR